MAKGENVEKKFEKHCLRLTRPAILPSYKLGLYDKLRRHKPSTVLLLHTMSDSEWSPP